MPRQQPVPITPEVLQWARKARGYTPARAAQILGIPRRTLSAIEKGDQHVDAALFKRMITAYQQVESVLLLPSLPETDPLPADFRSKRRTEGLSPQALLAIREARRIQHYVTDLVSYDRELIRHADIAERSLTDDAAAVAVEERRAFNVSIETQKRWKPGRESFDRWRYCVQARGILVIVERMPWEDCRGVSLWNDDLIPAIVVNSEDAFNGQIFTLFHEYAHLLLRKPAVCVHDDTEKWTNSFAANFLVPTDDLREFVSRRFGHLAAGDWAMGNIRKLATNYRVSQVAMALRLKELDITDFYDHHKTELYAYDRKPLPKDTAGKPRPAGWQITQRLAEMGSTAADVVLEALREEIIDPLEAADILDLKLDQLVEFEERTEVAKGKEARA